MDVGKRVRKWREAKGFSQRDAAAGAQISQAAWQALESGRLKRIGLDVADRIVAFMQGAIGLDDLRAPAKKIRAADPVRRTGTDG